MTWTEHEILTELNRAALKAAHRRGDGEASRKYSQEKERLKKWCFCVDCHVRINPRSTRCLLHANKHRFWARRIAAAL